MCLSCVYPPGEVRRVCEAGPGGRRSLRRPHRRPVRAVRDGRGAGQRLAQGVDGRPQPGQPDRPARQQLAAGPQERPLRGRVRGPRRGSEYARPYTHSAHNTSFIDSYIVFCKYNY